MLEFLKNLIENSMLGFFIFFPSITLLYYIFKTSDHVDENYNIINENKLDYYILPNNSRLKKNKLYYIENLIEDSTYVIRLTLTNGEIKDFRYNLDRKNEMLKDYSEIIIQIR